MTAMRPAQTKPSKGQLGLSASGADSGWEPVYPSSYVSTALPAASLAAVFHCTEVSPPAHC